MEEAQTQDSAAMPQPEVISPVAEVQQDTTTAQEAAPQKEVQSEEAEWIKNLRRQHKEKSRELEEERRMRKMQEDLLQRFVSQQSAPQQVSAAPREDIIQAIAKQDYVPGEQVAQALREQRGDFDRELAEIKKTFVAQQQNARITDLKREFPDFDQVVNPETIAKLDETNPRLAHLIAKNGDPYEMAVQTYEYIKASGLFSSQQQESRRAKETDMKIEQNKKTVQSPQAFDKRPMAVAFQMTDALKKEVQKEMYHFAQHAGMGY